MSAACPVAVRIRPHAGGYLVTGRRTSVWCATFDEAWDASMPYWRGEKL